MTKLTQTLIFLFFASISSCGTAIKPINLSEEGVMYLVKPDLINEDEVLCQFTRQKMEIYKIVEPTPDLRADIKTSQYHLKDDILMSILGTHEIERTSYGYNLRKAGKLQYQLLYKTGYEAHKKSKKENLL
jgi:hypothetical protein